MLQSHETSKKVSIITSQLRTCHSLRRARRPGGKVKRLRGVEYTVAGQEERAPA